MRRRVVTHMIAPDGITRCCRRDVKELPETDRVTAMWRKVTCWTRRPAVWPPAPHTPNTETR